MKSRLFCAAMTIATALPTNAFAKGSGAGGHANIERIGSGPGSERVDADKANVGKTPSLPSNVKQAVRRDAKSASKSADKK